MFELKVHVHKSTKVNETIRLSQVRSECLTCIFRASCCSARLSRTQVPTFTGSSVPLSGTGTNETMGVMKP